MPDVSPQVTLIAAMSRNRVIGRGGALPWRLPADMRRFKARTMGSAVIMGRRTWDSMNRRALPGRCNIIITRDQGLRDPQAIIAHDLDSAMDAARVAQPQASEIFVIGGAEIYRLALPLADRIDLTRIDLDIADGDAFFPEFEHDPAWRLAAREHHPADAGNPHAFAFETFERARG